MYSFSDCLAHSPDDYLKDHLQSVAKAAQNTSNGSGGYAGILAGLLHDIGKANRWFQDRIRGVDNKKTHYSHHSLVSAAIGWYLSSSVNVSGTELDRLKLSVFVAILRHHSDLNEPWYEELKMLKHGLEPSDGKHLPVMKAQLESMDLANIEEWFKEMVIAFNLPLTVPEINTELIIRAITIARPLRLQDCFKELADAIDFLCVYSSLLQYDKIHSASGSIERHRIDLPQDLAQRYVNEFMPKQYDNIAEIRKNVSAELEKDLLAHADKHFFTVTAPTGSGKTLAVLNAALKLRWRLQENEGIIPAIIYCLPFTSIIDQNYAVYHEVLTNAGLSVNSELLLKHHHLSEPLFLSSDPEFDPDNSELFTETWQSEIVVTTFHQLLYGAISNRNKNLKRFMSLKNAIVIMDEVQAVPHRYWQPLRKLFHVIGKRLNTRFILMTATQPLLFTQDMAVELINNYERYFEQLSRIRMVNRSDFDTTIENFFECVKDEMQKTPCQSRMCVLNRKSSVHKLYALFNAHLRDCHIYALSTNLTPKDRRKRIEKIKASLKAGNPTLIVTTQLVEAGVDISVDVVDRDTAPLDSIIQAAGRCNRHDSGTKGVVNVWSLVDNNERLWKRVYDPFLIDATREVLQGKAVIEEAALLKLGRTYFKLLIERFQPPASTTIDKILTEGKFSEIEKEFKLIDDNIPNQSYFIIQNEEDRQIWERYGELASIKDKMERKKTFGRFKGEFMERIVQTYSRNSGEGIIPVERELGIYSEELGFLGEDKMPGGIVL